MDVSDIISKAGFILLCLVAPSVWGLTVEFLVFKLRGKSACCQGGGDDCDCPKK